MPKRKTYTGKPLEELAAEEETLSGEIRQKIEQGRSWLGTPTLNYNYILKIFELADHYHIGEEAFFKMLKKMSAETETGISDLITQYDNPQDMPRGNEKYLFLPQAEYIINSFSPGSDLNRQFEECMDYLKSHLHTLFQSNPEPNLKTFFQQLWELCTGQQCTEGPPSRGLIPSESIHEYDQQYTTTCVPMVLTRIIKKIIELLFYYNTKGKNLGNYRFCNNPCFKDIYKINNVFIMQYLNNPPSKEGFERQCKYLFYLTQKCFEKFKDIDNICELFMYIYIHFYLFMFIISLLDSYLRDIPCDSVSCRLTFTSIIHNEEDLTTKGGLDDDTVFSICKKLEQQLFLIPPSEIIQNEMSEEGKKLCYAKYRTLRLHEETIEKICNYTPLSYIPIEVRSMLDQLFGVVNTGQPTMSTHYFQTYEMGIWQKLNNDSDPEVLVNDKLRADEGAIPRDH